MTARLIGVLALMLALAVAPLGAQDAPAEPDGTIELDNGGNADAAIRQRIRSILDELEGYDNVSVSVQAGVVTLTGRALDGEAVARLETLVNRVEGVVAIENEVTESTDLAERLTPAYDRIITRTAQMLALIPLILVALTAFLIVAGLGFFIARLKRPWNRIAPNEFIANLYRQVIRIAFLIGGLVIALDILGATALLGTILGAAGIIGLAIGFAVKDTVENFIASIMLSIRQPFRPNDLIEIGGDTGKVIRLTSRATILLSQNGNHIRIPNAMVFGSRIVNFTRNAERQFLFDLSIDASCDLSAARELCQNTLQELPFVLATPSPLVWIETIDDAGIVMRLTGWVDQQMTSYFPARGEAIRQTKAALEAAGIGLPSKTYMLQMAGDTADSASEARKPDGKTEVVNVDATDAEDLERMVEAERADAGTDDLLSREAQEE